MTGQARTDVVRETLGMAPEDDMASRVKTSPSRPERVEKLTRRPRKGAGKILTMRQLRKMTSILAKRMFLDANSKDLTTRDRKQSAVSYGVMVDKLVILAPHDKHGQIVDDGSPETRAAIQELGLRIAETAKAQQEQRGETA